MASIEVLRGRIRRGELRAAIAACGTLAQQRDWRNSNGEIREHIENNPHVRNPKDIAKRFVGRNSAAVRAERIAKPYGGSGKDIVREQAELWLERKLPENPHVLFMHLCFGGGTGVDAAAELADLPIATAWTLALRGLGHAYTLGRNMANEHWRRFLDAIETGQCVCECPHCALAKLGGARGNWASSRPALRGRRLARARRQSRAVARAVRRADRRTGPPCASPTPPCGPPCAFPSLPRRP